MEKNAAGKARKIVECVLHGKATLTVIPKRELPKKTELTVIPPRSKPCPT